MRRGACIGPPSNRTLYCRVYFVVACSETHLLKALDLFGLVPYLSLNAWLPIEVRSVLQVLAALTVACCCWSLFCFACSETHLPKALDMLALVAYFSSNAA